MIIDDQSRSIKTYEKNNEHFKDPLSRIFVHQQEQTVFTECRNKYRRNCCACQRHARHQNNIEGFVDPKDEFVAAHSDFFTGDRINGI